MDLPLSIGRYLLYEEIAAGGMATVHVGRLIGPAGFSRTVAIKRLHPMFAKDPEFVSMFLDEARLAARIRHANVVSTLDVVARDGELYLVMDYVRGSSLAALFRLAKSRKEWLPVNVACTIVHQALLGLDAAHGATDNHGRPLAIVHRDVSPQNILVGVDGQARVADFGVAKAASRAATTEEGKIKGKLAYMAPEQLLRQKIDRRTDVFAAGVVLWEALCGTRLFASDDPAAAVATILSGKVDPPSRLCEHVSKDLDEVVLKALAADAGQRFDTAQEMALAIQKATSLAPTLEVGAWVEDVAKESLARQATVVTQMESDPGIAVHVDGDAISPSEPSTDSEATRIDDRPRPDHKRRTPGLLLLPLGLVALGGVAVWQLRSSAHSEPGAITTEVREPGTTAVGIAPSTPPPPESPLAPAPEHSTPPPATSALPKAAARAHVVSSAPPRSTTNSASAASTATPSAKAPDSECSVPYIIGPDGVKRFNRKCFQ
ncbi:MAG: serine/threonine-protein kinase [Polyangiaceae bacterium]